MPIIDKIERARSLYTARLTAFRALAAKEREDTSFEKELIAMLTEMIEIKTELEILTRVHNHQSGEAASEH